MSEGSTTIDGHVEPGFETVREAFAHNFERGREIGSAFCVHLEGRKVVDLYGGVFDTESGRPYGQDALQLVFSSTKGAAAACANLLEQRGQLDLSAPVSTYWPEFAQGGKADLPVLYLLTHQAGLSAVDAKLTAEDIQGWTPIIDALAAQTPLWDPGTAHGYHALSYGNLVGEVVRRVSGKSIGTYFSEEIAQPLGLEFWIGLPAALEHRVSPIVGTLFGGDNDSGSAAPSFPANFSSTLFARTFNLGGAVTDTHWFNDPKWHAAEVPAAAGITNATSLSRLYAGLIGTVEGGPAEPLLTQDQIERARQVRTFGADQVFGSIGFPVEQLIGQGFWISSPVSPFGGDRAFGHRGAGGSFGLADPENSLAVGYVMNKMGAGMLGDPRGRGLLKACYESIGVTPKYL